MMQGPANQPVRPQLTSQSGQFLASALPQDGLPDAEGSTQPCHDAANGRHFNLRRRIPNQIYLAISNAPSDGYPTSIYRNARPLPFQGFHLFFFQEPRKTLLGVSAVFTNNSEGPPLGGFGNQPIEIRRIVGN